MRGFEVDFLREAVELFAAAGARYALWGEGSSLYRALGAIVSARAKVGWSTFSHTAVDVPLFSYGPGSDRFRGSMDNAEIGARLAALLELDLPAATAAIGTPLGAEEDAAGDMGRYTQWPPPP